MDWTTINVGRLRRFSTWTSPGHGHNWSVSTHPGMGCFGDPPGYPSYFLRSVYRFGNAPRGRHPTVVIRHDGEDRVIMRADESHDCLADRLRSLWVPPPADHERVRLWIRARYRDFRHCYRDDAGIVSNRDDRGMVIFPVPTYKLRTFHDDARFSDAWRRAEIAAIAAYNADVTARTASVATPDNHCAVRAIREFYPEHAPDPALISDTLPLELPLEGDWWTTAATRPSVAECRPRNGIGAQDHTCQWCQWCGRDPSAEG
jgi:hypothetical protein